MAGCSVLDVYDNGLVDSTWLSTFCHRATDFFFRVDRVLFVCDAGQWIAYLDAAKIGGYGRHKLVEVNYRFEVANLLKALKIEL
jgi:hypothetical protein